MNLETISIKNFRSIEDIEVENCGNFNVLIGKNNSGKSNILSAIHTFFTCIQSGNVVALDPPIGKAIDSFQKNTEIPIEITLTFFLSLAERDALIRDIVTESPQMKNAADGLDPSLRLSATITFQSTPKSFAFVSKIVLGGTMKPGAKQRDPERIIVKVGIESATELQSRISSSMQRNKDIAVLHNMTENSSIRRYLRDAKAEGAKASLALRYALSDVSEAQASSRILTKLEKMLDEPISYDDFTSAIQAMISELQESAKLQNEPLRHKIDTFAGEETTIPTYATNVLHKMSKLKVLYLTERRRPIGKEEADRLLLLKVKRGGPEVLRNIQETVSALLGVNIDAFSSDSVTQKGESNAELDVDNFLVQVNGSGIREALRLILDHEFEHPSILLVEEPETHLHPALETSMMRYLKQVSSGCQIFLTTHSTNFLDAGDMKNVYLISKVSSTQVRLLDSGEAEEHIPRELGIRLSSFFMFDRLVFVEGASDENILREWASTLGINFSQANVGFIHMGGVKNFAYFAAEQTLAFLAKRQVKLWFLMDRDEKDDEEIRRIKDRLKERAVIKFLEKREIENYLIHPRLIVESVKLRQQENRSKTDDNLPTEAEVNQKIIECAEKLKQLAIDKRVAKLICEPVYPSRDRLFNNDKEMTIIERGVNEIDQMIARLEEAKKHATRALSQQTEFVETNWQKNKLSLVPGDLLLDMVFKEYHLRFIKERDGVRLAALMKKGEIDQEIKTIIQEIGM